MDSNQLEVVKAAYYQNTETAVNARAILALTKGLKYMRYPYDLAGGERRSIPMMPNNQAMNISKFKIYPNPSYGEIKIELPYFNEESQVKIQIINSNGTVIDELKTIKGNMIISYSTSKFSSGLYFVLLLDNNIVSDKAKLVIVN
jgi:hypothetical protein